MLKRFLEFYRVSRPSVAKVPAEKSDKTYKNLRTQAFIAATIGFSLYYVCRTSLDVMKQPIIDAGFLDATQLGIIGACLYWTYAVGKFINGFLADHCNIKKFMATGLILSSVANFIMGFLGVWEGLAGVTGEIVRYDFTYVSLFWVGAAVISFILPIFNWKIRQQEI